MDVEGTPLTLLCTLFLFPLFRSLFRIELALASFILFRFSFSMCDDTAQSAHQSVSFFGFGCTVSSLLFFCCFFFCLCSNHNNNNNCLFSIGARFSLSSFYCSHLIFFPVFLSPDFHSIFFFSTFFDSSVSCVSVKKKSLNHAFAVSFPFLSFSFLSFFSSLTLSHATCCALSSLHRSRDATSMVRS